MRSAAVVREGGGSGENVYRWYFGTTVRRVLRSPSIRSYRACRICHGVEAKEIIRESVDQSHMNGHNKKMGAKVSFCRRFSRYLRNRRMQCAGSSSKLVGNTKLPVSILRILP